jgi:hypothetical protein
VQLLLVAGVADAADLRAADDRQQVEFVKGAGGFRESKAQTLAQKPSGRFISKMGGRPKGTLQDGRRTGMVTETARAAGVPGR